MKSHSTNRGFTLIEIITCLAIIVMLSALATPVLLAAKHSAKATITKSNLKQVHAALAIYRQDHDDHLPSLDDIIFGDGRRSMLGLPHKVWMSGCMPHPKNVIKGEAMLYRPGELREDSFQQPYAIYGERFVAVYDLQCTDPRVNINDPYVARRGIGILLDGTLVDRTAVGDPYDPAWWIPGP